MQAGHYLTNTALYLLELTTNTANALQSTVVLCSVITCPTMYHGYIYTIHGYTKQ